MTTLYIYNRASLCMLSDQQMSKQSKRMRNHIYKGSMELKSRRLCLLGFDDRVRYFERTLYEDDCSSTKFATRDMSYESEIEK